LRVALHERAIFMKKQGPRIVEFTKYHKRLATLQRRYGDDFYEQIKKGRKYKKQVPKK
jgi:hypothetical protein